MPARNPTALPYTREVCYTAKGMALRHASLIAVLGLGARVACAQSVHVRGPAEVDSPRAFGNITVRVSLFDAETGGRLLWRSPAFFAWAKSWRWLFAGVRGPSGEAALRAMPKMVFAEFESGNTVFKPRQPFHRSAASGATELVFDPGASAEPAQTPAAATVPPRPAAQTLGPAARPETTDEEGGILVGTGAVALPDPKPVRQPATAPPPKVAPAPHEPSLDDLRLSNDLYFQALREYRTGNPSLALSKLEVALRLNPANAEARVAQERIGQETDAPSAPSGAVPSPEAVRRAQDLYFEALRHYAKAELGRAENALARAAQADPTDRGVATALVRLRRERVLAPHVVH